MARIIINGIFYNSNLTGIERFAHEIVRQLDKICSADEVLLVLPANVSQPVPDFQNIKVKKLPKTPGRKQFNNVKLDIFLFFHRGICIDFTNHIMELCQKNDIKWWLCSGTLLGAVRHGGFIPWDDDVDVSMLEKDYRKLQKVLKKLGKEDEYFFQSIQTDPDHYYRFGKFLRKGDSIPTYARFYQQKGIGLDVFYIVKSSQFAAHMGKFFYLNSRCNVITE